ncbi:serine hydrolase domain-containing protein [Streptomyces sp. NPDC059256]|uniref:serine hydrolase domain-containing protein n=1 Tax=Streptomyces sp. NPDC059256 TaxID=3346794 RepID=UPI00367FF5E8
MRPIGAALMTHGGHAVYETYEGVADEDTGAVCGPDTRFQIASLSKQFAAAAALLLVEDGVLALTDRVSTWLADAPEQWADITLHRLLTHTSGLPHWHALPALDREESPTREEVAADVMGLLPLPGRRAWHYSSPGYVLVALMIERASGSDYGDFLRTRIFSPLDLAATTIGTAPPAVAALGHRGPAVRGSGDVSWMPGSGDLWSTARDLARWARAVERGELLSDGSLRAMFTQHCGVEMRENPLTVTGYGYGVFLGELAGRAARFHHGDNQGYRSLLVRLPESDTGIVVLTHDECVDPYAWLSELVQLPAFPRRGAAGRCS